MKTFDFFRFKTFVLLAAMAVIFFSCKEDEEEPVVESETYTLSEFGGSGISGTAKFEKVNETTTRITVQLTGTTQGNMHPMHIHNNSASEGGGIAISLEPVNGDNGMSVTEVTQMDNGTPITYEELIDFNGYINVHLSSTQMGTTIVRGDIGQNAP